LPSLLRTFEKRPQLIQIFENFLHQRCEFAMIFFRFQVTCSFEPGEHRATFSFGACLPSSAPLALVGAKRTFIEPFYPRYRQALWLFDSNTQGSFTVFHDEDLQPVIRNSIALSGAAIRAFFGPTKKIQYYGSKWIVNVN
jgi:hypothetical protein